MTFARSWDQAERVLCVRLDALGDLLMTGPAIRALKWARPGRQVDVLTSHAAAAITPYLPGVDDVLIYQAPWMKATPRRSDAKYDREFVERLRQQRYDAAVIFTVYSQNPLPAANLCYLADIPLRLAHCRENPYQLLTDWVKEPEPEQGIRHEVRRQLDLVAHVGVAPDDTRLKLRLPTRAFAQARAMLAAQGIDPGSRWVLIHPGASAPSRRYAPERFADVARELVQTHGYRVVFTADEHEVELIQRIQADMRAPSCSLAGRLDTGTLCAVIALAPVFVCNNTGPAHMAAAVGTPIVDLYALTNPQHTPWNVESRVLNRDVACKYCYKSACPAGHHDCLRVPPEDVVAATLELLAARADEARVAQQGAG
jgi:lipopolysaccharide heptosyltransferase II